MKQELAVEEISQGFKPNPPFESWFMALDNETKNILFACGIRIVTEEDDNRKVYHRNKIEPVEPETLNIELII